MSDAGSRRPGQSGEDLACSYLRGQGMRILQRNFRCRGGEIDVVAQDGDTIVFVEVKERTGSSHGTAIEAVTPLKRQRIVRTARVYAAGHRLSEVPLRFDVVGIDWGPDGPCVRHEPDAFGEG